MLLFNLTITFILILPNISSPIITIYPLIISVRLLKYVGLSVYEIYIHLTACLSQYSHAVRIYMHGSDRASTLDHLIRVQINIIRNQKNQIKVQCFNSIKLCSINNFKNHKYWATLKQTSTLDSPLLRILLKFQLNSVNSVVFP